MAKQYQSRLIVLKSASDPSSPAAVAGEVYYNTTANELRYYNGSAWVATSAGGRNHG